MPVTGFPTDYGLEAQAIERNRRLADLLQQDSQQPLANPMSGGWAVPISPFQGLNKMAQAYVGAKGQEAADARQRALAAQIRGDTQATMTAYAKALESGDAKGALSILSNSPNPAFQQMALTHLMKQNEPFNLREGERRYGPGGIPIAENPKTVPLHFANTGSAITPMNALTGVPQGPTTPVSAPPAQTPAPVTELTIALKNAQDPNMPEADRVYWKNYADKLSTHQPAVKVTTNVSTERKYGEQFAGQIAQADSAMRDAAIKAPELADRAITIKNTLASGKVITGTAADFRLQLGKALNLVGANDGETVANTETLVSQLASNTMDAIKASGMGGGTGFSNADRDFLEKAKGGRITLQAETIDRLAGLAHRAATLSAQRWNTRVKQIPGSALEGTGITTEPIGVSPLPSGPLSGASGPARITSDAQYNALPSGSVFIGPDGKQRRKP